MAEWYRAQITIPHDNGLPRDAITNTFAFMVEGTADRELVAGEINARLDGFYSDLSTVLSSQYTWANAVVKVYDMLEPQPRYPFSETTISISEASTTSNDLPPEVAIVLSFEGERESGVNMRRRRGRVYIGPWRVGSADYPTTSTALADLLALSAKDNLLDYTPALCKWAVYSPSTHYGKAVGEPILEGDEENPEFLPASFSVVQRLWVDDAWDTQRRRGTSAAYRKTYTGS